MQKHFDDPLDVSNYTATPGGTAHGFILLGIDYEQGIYRFQLTDEADAVISAVLGVNVDPENVAEIASVAHITAAIEATQG